MNCRAWILRIYNRQFNYYTAHLIVYLFNSQDWVLYWKWISYLSQSIHVWKSDKTAWNFVNRILKVDGCIKGNRQVLIQQYWQLFFVANYQWFCLAFCEDYEWQT